MFLINHLFLFLCIQYRVYQKTEQILNRSQFWKIAFGIKFLIYTDHLGTYNVKQLLTQILSGGVIFSQQTKNSLCTKFECLNVILSWWVENMLGVVFLFKISEKLRKPFKVSRKLSFYYNN